MSATAPLANTATAFELALIDPREPALVDELLNGIVREVARKSEPKFRELYPEAPPAEDLHSKKK
jgi:hypothetical protein